MAEELVSVAVRLRGDAVGVRITSYNVCYTKLLRDDPLQLKKFMDGNSIALADDHDGQLVFLARNAWHLGKAEEEFPELRFLKTRESGG